MADRIDLVVTADGIMGAEHMLRTLDRWIEQTIRRGEILGKMQMSPVARLTDKLSGPAARLTSALVKLKTVVSEQTAAFQAWGDAGLAALQANGSMVEQIRWNWDDIVIVPFAQWWGAGGEAGVSSIAIQIGTAVKSGIQGALQNVFESLANEKINIAQFSIQGTLAGQTFFSSFAAAFDPKKLTEKMSGSTKEEKKEGWLQKRLSGIRDFFENVGANMVAGWATSKILEKVIPLLGKIKSRWKGNSSAPAVETPEGKVPQTRVEKFGKKGSVLFRLGRWLTGNETTTQKMGLSAAAETTTPPTSSSSTSPKTTTNLGPRGDVQGRVPPAASAEAEGLAKSSKFLSGTARVSKFLGRAAWPVAIVGEAYDISKATDKKTAAIKSASGLAGGAFAGAAAGAALGSVVPGIGTVVGGLIGGALGYYGGKSIAGLFLGDKSASKSSDKTTSGNSNLPNAFTDLSGIVETVSAKFRDLSNQLSLIGPEQFYPNDGYISPTIGIPAWRPANIDFHIPTTVNVDMSGTDVDYDEIAQQVGWQIAEQIRRSVENRG